MSPARKTSMRRGPLRVLVLAAAIAGQTGCYDWVLVTPADIKGRTTRELRVTTLEGTSEFGKASVRVEGDRMRVESVNHPPKTYALSDVAVVEQLKLDAGRTGMALCWAAFGAILVFGFARHMQFPGDPFGEQAASR